MRNLAAEIARELGKMTMLENKISKITLFFKD